ncbi:MAG: hypothetical protein Q8K30_06100 [Candidatus Gracilibacteria bacterium]|nr:hypothetical protein [Candidatus Gracilibacteria bacterium]
MKIKSNYSFSSLLGISHFFTDSIAAFALTTISINSINIDNFFIDKYEGIQLLGYFFLYNFIAFFMQIFVGYFLDKIIDNQKFYDTSKMLIIFSFLFYILGTILLSISYFLAIISVGIGSCLFHIGAGNISILADENKATNLGIFASGGVVGLSFGGFCALYFANIYLLVDLILIFIGYIIFTNKSYKIESNSNINKYKNNNKYGEYLSVIVLILGLVLIIRSSIWTYFQFELFDNKLIIFYIAISAFIGKLSGGILEDSKYFKEKYLIYIGILSILFIYLYLHFINNLIFLLIGIVGIQMFISPITFMIYKLIPEKRSEIIGFTFGLSLIFGYLLVM